MSHIHYNALPIPATAPVAEEVVPHFESIRRLEMPGLYIPEVGSDEQSALSNLKPILAACGVSIHAEVSSIDVQKGKGDHPLHLDAIPSNDPSVGMVMRYTVRGNANVILATLAQPFCDELVSRNKDAEDALQMDYTLPPDTDRLLDEGLVDPDVLQPDVYVGSVAAGSAIMFTFGGPNPIAHRFRSTTADRYAKGYIIPFIRA